MADLKRNLAGVLAGLIVLSANPAFATTQSTMTILNVGVQWNSGYVHFTSPFSVTCAYDALYIDLTTEGGRVAFSILLTARASGVMINRVDYTTRPDGTCWVDLVEL